MAVLIRPSAPAPRLRRAFPGPGRANPFPGDYRARLVLYLALQAVIFLAPGPWILPAGVAVLALGWSARVRWGKWLTGLGPLLGIILLPAAAGLPEALAGAAGSGPDFLGIWAPALRRSLTFLLVLASSEWLSRTSLVSEIRDALEGLLRPLGSRGRRAALAASLALGFLPWARDELVRADEAARLRGSDPRTKPLRHLAALGVPVLARLLEKARLSSEALALRDSEAMQADEGG